MIEGSFFKSIGDGKVQCHLCPHYCKISNGASGICKVRKNIDGKLFSLNSDKVIAVSSDPIEKKPLYHFLPASISYSVAAMGCNFSCDFCQNHTISMVNTEHDINGMDISAEEIVTGAIQSGAKSIAYTYTEPTIYFELMEKIIKKSKSENIKNIMVTNGFMSDELIDVLIKDIDALNIDIKAYSEKFYNKYCKGSLAPVLNTIKRFSREGIHVELTTLLINGLNDNEEEIKKLIDFILENDYEIPWHISRFFPTYKMSDYPPTDIDTIYRIAELGYKMGLKYIYTGNIQDNAFSDTICPDCKKTLIKRSGYFTEVIALKSGRCSSCEREISGIWENNL